jgi:hypothetical protein
VVSSLLPLLSLAFISFEMRLAMLDFFEASISK